MALAAAVHPRGSAAPAILVNLCLLPLELLNPESTANSASLYWGGTPCQQGTLLCCSTTVYMAGAAARGTKQLVLYASRWQLSSGKL